MTTTTLRSVRYAFVMFLLALTAFTVAESAVGARSAAAPAEGLTTCGTVEQPCTLETVSVTVAVPEAAPAATQLAAEDEGLTACGSEDQPCRLEAVEVTAPASTGRLASTERTMGMTLRVRS